MRKSGKGSKEWWKKDFTSNHNGADVGINELTDDWSGLRLQPVLHDQQPQED